MSLRNPIKINARKKPGVFGAVKNKQLFDKLYPLAVKMRREPTDAERILWQELRAKKLGVKFRRQHLIDQFIVDFYCVELGLVVEVDGEIHMKKLDWDKERELILKGQGCRLVRFTNKEVEEDLPKIVSKIKDIIHSLSQRGILAPTPDPFPRCTVWHR